MATAGAHPKVASAKDHGSRAEPALALLPLPGGGSAVVPEVLVGRRHQRARPVLLGPEEAEVIALLQGPAAVVGVRPLQGLAGEAVEAHVGRTKTGKPEHRMDQEENKRGKSFIWVFFRLMVGKGKRKEELRDPLRRRKLNLVMAF